jgi:hypothetical protein
MRQDASRQKARLADVASRRDPRRAPWGYYVCDDNVFGAGLFLWFNTRQGLLQFLADYEGPDQGGADDVPRVRAGMRKVANQVLAGRLGLEKGRLRFNKVLQGYLDIEWIGQFEEMLSGKHPLAQKVRADLLGTRGGASVPAIAAEDVREFIEEVRGF